MQGDGGQCVSSSARQSFDPGCGPEPETDYEPAYGGLLGMLDEIQVLEGPTEARMPEPAVMRAWGMPGEQTTVATATSKNISTNILINRINVLNNNNNKRKMLNRISIFFPILLQIHCNARTLSSTYTIAYGCCYATFNYNKCN